MEIELGRSGGLWCFAYRSTQAKRMTRADIAALLRKAQMRNVNRHITGLLLRVDDRFVQYFEGPQLLVSDLWACIQVDPRHQDVQHLFSGPLKERLFPHWALAFVDLSGSLLPQGTHKELLQRILEEAPPADGRGHEGDIFHRFWADSAASLPR